MKQTAAAHPAPYSEAVLAMFGNLGPFEGARVHDPFAGTGERLGQLADERGWAFTGTELEKEFICDPRVVEGNACDAETYPAPGYFVVTSPAYPNGIADDFNAQDGSERRTYRSSLAKLAGGDRPLHADNQGRWGYRGTPIHSARRAVYWSIADRAVRNWAGASELFVNVSDFMHRDRTEPVVERWAGVLHRNGWMIGSAWPVLTMRYRNGANSAARVANEVILHAMRPR